MNAILFVLRTGCQWNALSATGICSCSSAYRRFREWTDAGVFLELWRRQLIDYDRIKGIEWEWLAADGAMTKSPPRRRTDRSQSHRQSQVRGQTQSAL
jgi:transposase